LIPATRECAGKVLESLTLMVVEKERSNIYARVDETSHSRGGGDFLLNPEGQQ